MVEQFSHFRLQNLNLLPKILDTTSRTLPETVLATDQDLIIEDLMPVV